ncbi:hypothetical protein BGZ74_006486 [Mortierella antarctica]|nr:hypothetical protein BGZ74_006486 [Mortierella antarctica]
MTNIKRQLQIQDDEEQQEEVDDQSPGPGLKRARHNNSTETRASPDTNLLNEEEHIGAEPEHEVNDDPPLIRHRRHFVISDSDTDLSSAEETDISDRGIASDHIYGARGEDDDNVIADQPPSFEDQNERNVAGASNRKPVLTTPPATPSVASEAGSSIQWPVLLTKSDMPSPEEVVTSRQKSRAIKKELADSGLRESTAWCYSQYLFLWEAFCNKFYRGDGTLTSEKIHHFFKDDLFVGKPTTVMVEDKRNIVIGVTKHDPSVHPTEASAEAAMIRSRFEAAMRESNISAPHGTHSPGIRNRAVFALERQLLVPYQDLVTLDLVDSFTEHFDITHNGSTCNLRGEPFPDFKNVSKWPRTKLFRNMEIFEPTSVRAVEEAIRVTLIASGVKDRGLAQSDGAIRDLAGLGIRVEGPIKMDSHGETPRGLAALSGYHNEPYKLRRDVIPPLELQRQIFPMIENQYGSMDPAQWRAYCDEVMKDPSASPGLGLKQGAARLSAREHGRVPRGRQT